MKVHASIIWTIVDVLVAVMAIINMYAVYSLRNVIKKELVKFMEIFKDELAEENVFVDPNNYLA